jgi:hypothetical protein
MNKVQRVPRFMTSMAYLFSYPRDVLQNPLWYVTTITILTGLTYYIRGLWWLVGAIALIWGLWLIWLLFSPAEASLNHEALLPNYLDQALIYRGQIDQILRATSKEDNSAHRQRLATRLNHWVEAIRDLAERISGLRNDNVIQQDRINVPKAIENLEAQLAPQTDPVLRLQLERLLVNRKKQLASLVLLQNTITQAEFQIENTLALLGTIYSQILTSHSTNQVADYGRLLVEVDEDVHRLQDQLEALQEVKASTHVNYYPSTVFRKAP